MFTLVSSITAEGSVAWSSCQVLQPAMETSVTGHGGDQGCAKRSIPELNYCAAEMRADMQEDPFRLQSESTAVRFLLFVAFFFFFLYCCIIL